LERPVIPEQGANGNSGSAISRPKRVFDRHQVERMIAEGASLRQIARKLGVGYGTVYRTLRASGNADSRSKTL
jgi:DNA invertase Pin-like site-specific DNA recombinase